MRVMRWRGRALQVLAIWLVSACSESLFGAHAGDDTGPDGGAPDTCPSTCIADAAAAFDGTPDGADDHWRYLGDQRDRTWTAMTPVARAMVGTADNRIERCTDQKSADACVGLPRALLVTSSGTASPSDPALEYTISQARVVQLALRAYVPGSSAEHRVRLYRNSREDVLFTAAAAPGATVAHTITVDALAGDRFLIALEPTGRGGTAALQFFISDAGTSFPATCQLALEFSDRDITGAVVDDLCGGAFTSILDTMPTAPTLVSGPFPYHALGLHLAPGSYLLGSGPLAGGDTTLQFWVQYEPSSAVKTTVFSDIDEPAGHGLRLQFDNTSGLQLAASVVGATSPVTYTSQHIAVTSPDQWHFVRIVHAGGTITFCLDGGRVMSFPLPGSTAPGIAPYLGRNGPWNPPDEFLGALDDLRVFSGALPCNE